MDYNDAGVPRWQTEHSEELIDCTIFTVRRDWSRVPGTDRTGTFYVLDSPAWVNIVPITTNNEVLFVAQYRHGTNQISLETPGGLIDKNEDPIQAAARELREETGYTAQRLRVLAETDANSAIMNNRFTAVLAEGATLTDPTAWDEHEEIEPVLVPLAELPALLRSGKIRNTYSVLPLCWYLWEQASGS